MKPPQMCEQCKIRPGTVISRDEKGTEYNRCQSCDSSVGVKPQVSKVDPKDFRPSFITAKADLDDVSWLNHNKNK